MSSEPVKQTPNISSVYNAHAGNDAAKSPGSISEIINQIIEADTTLADKAARFHALIPERSESGHHQPSVGSDSSQLELMCRIGAGGRGLFGLAVDWIWPLVQSDQPTANKISALFILSSMYTQAAELDPFRGVYEDVWVSGRWASDIAMSSSPAIASTAPSDSILMATIGLILLLGKSNLIEHRSPSEIIRQCPSVEEVVRPRETNNPNVKDARSVVLTGLESTVWLSLGALSKSLGIRERKTLSRALSEITVGHIPGLFVPSEISSLVHLNPSIGVQVVRSALSLRPLGFPKATGLFGTSATRGKEEYAVVLGTLPPSLSSLDVFSNLLQSRSESPSLPPTVVNDESGKLHRPSDTHAHISTEPGRSGKHREEQNSDEVRELMETHALGRFLSGFIDELDRLDRVRGEEEQVRRLVRILSLFLSNLVQPTDRALPETIRIESTSFALRFSRFEDAQRLYVLLSSSSSSSSSAASSSLSSAAGPGASSSYSSRGGGERFDVGVDVDIGNT